MAKKAQKAAKSSAKVAAKKPAKKAAAKPVKKMKKAASEGGAALATVTPGFTVNDAAASIAWYRDVLGFAMNEKWEPEGQLLGAEMRSGTVSINLGQDDWKLGRDRKKGQGTRIYVTTGPDIDALANQIKARGGALDHEPTDGWGMRAFAITDPDGFKITFMTPLKK